MKPYHSVFDTFLWQQRYGDPGLKRTVQYGISFTIRGLTPYPIGRCCEVLRVTDYTPRGRTNSPFQHDTVYTPPRLVY